MKPKEKELTNESLTKQFKDNFDVAITAIKVAQNEVLAGHEVTMQKILSDIKSNPRHYINQDNTQQKD